MYQRRVISEITSIASSSWYVVSFPITILGFVLSLISKWVMRQLLSISLVQCVLSPRFGDTTLSRIGRILFTSQNVYSFLGGSLAGLAFLVVYFNVSLVRFDGSYYVAFGGETRAYAEEVIPQVVAVPEVTPIAVSTVETPLVADTNTAQTESSSDDITDRLISGTVRAGYRAKATPLPQVAVGGASIASVSAPTSFAGSFLTPLRNPPRLLLTTYFRSGHPGIDMSTELGTPLHAVADGVVSATGSSIWAYGKVVTIDHGDGWQSMYAHMSRVDVKVGDYVTQSSVIGAVGSTGNSTGPHVHFEVHKNGVPVNPKGLVAGI